jgi:hypothetical protein
MKYSFLVQLSVTDTNANYLVQKSQSTTTLSASTSPLLGTGKVYNYQKRIAAGNSVTFWSYVPGGNPAPTVPPNANILNLNDIKQMQINSDNPVVLTFGSTSGASAVSFNITYMCLDFPTINASPLIFTLSIPPVANGVTQTTADVQVTILGREYPYSAS